MIKVEFPSSLLPEYNFPVSTWSRADTKAYINLTDMKGYLYYFETNEIDIQELIHCFYHQNYSIEDMSFIFRMSLYETLIPLPKPLDIANYQNFNWIPSLSEEKFNFLISLNYYFQIDGYDCFNYETFAYFLLSSDNLLAFLMCEKFEEFEGKWHNIGCFIQTKFITCVFLSFFPILQTVSDIAIDHLEKILLFFEVFDGKENAMDETEDRYFYFICRIIKNKLGIKEEEEEEVNQDIDIDEELKEFYSEKSKELLTKLIDDLNQIYELVAIEINAEEEAGDVSEATEEEDEAAEEEDSFEGIELYFKNEDLLIHELLEDLYENLSDNNCE